MDGSSLTNKTFLRESGGGKLPGVVTTEGMKESMSREMRHNLKYKRTKFHSDFLCVCSGKKVTPSMMKEKMLQQLSMFMRVSIPSTNEYQKDKIIYTGKMHGGTDDVVMALYLSLYSRVLYEDNEEKYHDEMYRMI